MMLLRWNQRKKNYTSLIKKIEFLFAFKQKLIQEEKKAFCLLNTLNRPNQNLSQFLSHHQAFFASSEYEKLVNDNKSALLSASQLLVYPPECADLHDACEKMKLHYRALSEKHVQVEKNQHTFSDFTLPMIKNFILHLDEVEKEIVNLKKNSALFLNELKIMNRMRREITKVLCQSMLDFEKENWAYSPSTIPFYFTEADVAFAIRYIDHHGSDDIKKRIDAYTLLEKRFSVHLNKQVTSLSPPQLIDSDAVFNIEMRNQDLYSQAKKLIQDQKALTVLNKKISSLMLQKKEKKSWFQRLANRVARFVGIDPNAKKAKQIKLLKKQYAETESAYKAEKAIYEKRKLTLLDDAHSISESLISNISAYLENINASQSASESIVHAEQVKKIRTFIANFSENELLEFEDKLNFVAVFFDQIKQCQSLEDLNITAKKIQICQPGIFPIIDKILLLLQGQYLYRNLSVIKTHVHTAYDHAYQKKDEVDCIVKSITEHYLPTLIFQNCEKNHQLLQYYSDSEKSALFLRQIEMKINQNQMMDTEKTLSYFCHIAVFYKEADNYQTIRDNILKSLFNHIDFSSVNQYDLEYLIDMTEKTRQENESSFHIISIASDAIANHIKSLKPESEWNRETATIVESYCSDEAIKQSYRTKGLAQLIKKASNEQSIESCETEWISFLEIHKRANWKPFSLTDEQKNLVEQIATDSNPTWMHELIVKKLGEESQLQNMHAKWFMKLIDLLEEGHVSPSDLSIEKVLRELCELHISDSMTIIQKNTLFLSLVGRDNAAKIYDRFVLVVNKIKSSADDISACASAQIAIMGGSVFEFLFNAFCADKKSNQNFKTWALEANAYVERLVAIHDMNTLTAEMTTHLDNIFKDDVTDDHINNCAYVQTVLMQRPKDRVAEKTGRYSTLLAQNKAFSDFEKRENPAFDFSYENNPDVFYDYHRLPLLQDCLARISKSEKPHLYKEKFNKMKQALFQIKENHLKIFLPYLNAPDKNNFLRCDAATLLSVLTAISESDKIPKKICAAAKGLLESIHLLSKIETCFVATASPDSKEALRQQKQSSFSCLFNLFGETRKADGTAVAPSSQSRYGHSSP